ncbi:MAG: hypothetical protein U0527_14440 [Candidatus Eisenbacteria bacterium]
MVEIEPRALASQDADSVRLGQAIELWAKGTADGRHGALAMLEDLRTRFWDSPAYHLLRGEAYLDGNRGSDARAAFRLAAAVDSTAWEARLLLSGSLIDAMLDDLSLDGLSEATRELDGVLRGLTRAASESTLSRFEREEEKTARYQKALLLFHQKRGVTRLSEKVRLTREALDLLAPITSGYPRGVSSEACMIRAMLALDLDEPREAALWFEHMLSLMDVQRKSIFRVPLQLNDDPRFRGATDTMERGALADAYWDGFRSDDGELIPEQLEYFYNTGLALLYFPDRRRDGEGVSMVGQAVQRFGLPTAKSEWNPTYDDLSAAAGVSDPTFGVVHDRTRGAENEKVELVYPGGITLTFERSVDGSYAAANFSTLHLTNSPELPPVVAAIKPESIDGLYLSTAGFRAAAGRTRERFVVCVPPWGAQSAWWRGASYSWDLSNSQGLIVASAAQKVEQRHFYDTGVPSAGGVLLIGSELDLVPGTYHLDFHIEDSTAGESGTRRFRLDVPNFEPAKLELSELSLAMPGSERWAGEVVRQPNLPFLPNVLSAVRQGDETVLYYELYNLTPSVKGLDYGRCSVELKVVPVRYRQEFGKRAASGKLRESDRSRFGALGDQAGDVTLDPGNSQTVTFPERSLRLIQEPSRGLPGVVISTASLRPGKYRAVVTLRDAVAKSEAIREITFHVVEPADYDAVWSRSN